MKTFIKIAFLVLLALGAIAGPAALVVYGPAFMSASTFFELLRTYLATTAIVGALWAVYLKDTRLRAGSEYVLVSLFFFVLTLAVSSIGALLLLLDLEVLKPVAAYFGYLALIMYVSSLVLLVSTGLVQSYNEVYNLRTNKFYKYFRPFRWLRSKFANDKSYELSCEPRDYEVGRCALLSRLFDLPEGRERNQAGDKRMAGEKERIKEGASILLTGTITAGVIDDVAQWIVRRLEKNETANYVVCDRHPRAIWEKLKSHGLDEKREGIPLINSIVLIDVFTPAFGFTDDIHQDDDRHLENHGMATVKAKTLAGLHTAVNRAFNIIKQKDKQHQHRNVRRASVMVYSNTSALSDTESIEQFRVFWRHVIPSERRYGMITVIIEDEMAGPAVINPLRELVDFVLAYDATESRFNRLK